MPVTVEYVLTPLGRKLTEAVAAFAHWAEANMDAIRKAQALTPDKLTTPPPPRLVAHIAGLLGVTADSILAKPPAEAAFFRPRIGARQIVANSCCAAT